MKHTSQAVVLYRSDYSNTSQVVSLLTRDRGRIDGLAKGAHRSKNPFQGPFDLGILYEVTWIERRAGQLAILTEAEVLEGFRALRRDLGRHVLAAQTVELLQAVSMPAEPTPGLFDLARAAWIAIDREPLDELPWRLLHFEVLALRELGFLPSVDACASCGQAWPGKGRPAYFSAIEGGLICRACRSGRSEQVGRTRARGSGQGRRRTPDGTRKLSGEAVAKLGELAERELLAAPACREGSATTLRNLHHCLAESYTALLERPLRMLPYTSVWIRDELRGLHGSSPADGKLDPAG